MTRRRAWFADPMARRIFTKLYRNVLSPRACSVLGAERYARLLGAFAVRLPAILRSRDLRPLDEAMSGADGEFRYRGVRFRLDMPFCDREVRDGSFAFGGVREICIRNCYFRHHDSSVFDSARVVVDIGANRGVFSTLMATVASHVLCVEGQPHFGPVIERNMAVNHFRNYAVDCAVMGTGGILPGDSFRPLTMEQLFERHGLERVDLVKMDIEGSEFSLFKTGGWLERVAAISMEVHRAHGDPGLVIETLRSRGFEVRMADENLGRVDDPGLTDFIYASRGRRSSGRAGS